MQQREKIGEVNIDWMQAAFGKGKKRRKTVGFGKYDRKEKKFEVEVYVRELSIIDAGIGSGVWDASIIFARWIFENKDFFKGFFSSFLFFCFNFHEFVLEKDKVVIELGAGCGLPGILCARFAKQVFLTDYMEQLVENLEYNVKLNSNVEEEGEGEEKEMRGRVLERCKVLELDWEKEEKYPPFDVLPKADIVIGSELTYSDLNIQSLVRVVERYLHPSGVFYEVLSDDRDGVVEFLKRMEERGWRVEKRKVGERFYGNFNTKQRQETYHFYSFYPPRSTSTYPLMN